LLDFLDLEYSKQVTFHPGSNSSLIRNLYEWSPWSPFPASPPHIHQIKGLGLAPGPDFLNPWTHAPKAFSILRLVFFKITRPTPPFPPGASPRVLVGPRPNIVSSLDEIQFSSVTSGSEDSSNPHGNHGLSLVEALFALPLVFRRETGSPSLGPVFMDSFNISRWLFGPFFLNR